MPTAPSDLRVLAGCAVAVVAGVALIVVGLLLDPAVAALKRIP